MSSNKDSSPPSFDKSSKRPKPDLTAIKRWLEVKHRRQAGPGEEVVSIVSSGDEFPASDDPLDGEYRGRNPARSRIGTVQAIRDDVSPLRTRRSARFHSPDPHSAAKGVHPDGHTDSDVSHCEGVDNPTTTASYLKRRKVRHHRSGAPSTKKARYQSPNHRSRATPSPLSSDFDIPTAAEIIDDAIASRAAVPTFLEATKSDEERQYLLRFFDDEASVDDSDDSSQGEDQAMAKPDDYDYADSFIDDGVDCDGHVDSDVSMPSHRPGSTHSRGTDSDAMSEDSAVVSALKALTAARAAKAAKKQDAKNAAKAKGAQDAAEAKAAKKAAKVKAAKDAADAKAAREHAEAMAAEEEAKAKAAKKAAKEYARAKAALKAREAERAIKEAEKAAKEAERAKRAAEKAEKHSTLKTSSHRDLSTKQSESSTKRKSLSYDPKTSKDTSILGSPFKDVPSRGSTTDLHPSNSREGPRSKGSKSLLKAAGGAKDAVKKMMESSMKAQMKPSTSTPSKTSSNKKEEPDIVEISSESSDDERTTTTPSKSKNPTPTINSSAGSSKQSKPTREKSKAVAEHQTPSSKAKGKARAPARSPSPVRRDPDNEDDGSDDGLSPYERAELQKAIAASKAVSTSPTKPGESSSSGTSSPAARSPPAAPDTPSAPSQMSRMKDFLASLPTTARTAQSPAEAQHTPSAAFVPDANTVRRCTELPDVDEVNESSLQDPALAPQYVGLPNLRSGTLIPWTDLPGKGFIAFSVWGDWIPDMNARNAFEVVNFTQAGPMRNPARASPLDVAMRTVPGSSEKYNFYCATNPAVPLVAVSSGWLERSQLISPSGTGLRQKYVSVIMHTQEWERTTGFIRTASGFPQLHAQLARNALQFSSRAQATRSPASPGDSPSNRRAVPANMFRNATGRNATSSTVSTDNFSLANDAIVPVYDARNVASLDLEEVLPRLSQVLPIYTGGEIPYGSFVTVGYTMTIYRSNSGMWTLGCNVLWIIVLGIPPTA